MSQVKARTGQWTDDIPTEPGHYWIQSSKGPKLIVQAYQGGETMYFMEIGHRFPRFGFELLDRGDKFWSEPIAVPEG